VGNQSDQSAFLAYKKNLIYKTTLAKTAINDATVYQKTAPFSTYANNGFFLRYLPVPSYIHVRPSHPTVHAFQKRKYSDGE